MQYGPVAGPLCRVMLRQYCGHIVSVRDGKQIFAASNSLLQRDLDASNT